MEDTTRKIVAILFSDIAGYTAAMGQDEDLAIRAVSRARSVQKELVRKFHGDWVQEVGDGSLCTFASAVEAVSCALEIQRAFSGDPDFKLRIGIHVGDIVFRKSETGYDVFGDGVNVASRVQGVAEPGGICVSERVYDDLRNRKHIEARFLGEQQLKNVNRPIGIYALLDRQALGAQGGEAAAAAPARGAGRRLPLVAAALLAAAGIGVLAWWLLGRAPAESSPPQAAQPAAAQPAEAETPPQTLSESEILRALTPQAPAAPHAAPQQPQEQVAVAPRASAAAVAPRPQAAPPAVAPAPAATTAAVAPPGLAFDTLRRALLARVGPAGEVRPRVDTDPNPVPNEQTYHVVFEAECDCDAMLFAINGSDDEIALLYPNPFDPSQRLSPGERRTLPSTGAYKFRAVGGEGVDMLKLFVTPREFSFPAANINAWLATPNDPDRLAELARWLDSLEKIPFATSVTPLQIRR